MQGIRISNHYFSYSRLLKTEHDLIENLYERNVDGLIMATMMNRDQFNDLSSKIKIPIVLVDRRIDGDGIYWVVSDDEQGTYELF